MKISEQNFFKKGEWCPLFGAIPRFVQPQNSVHNLLIDTILEARQEGWNIMEPEGFPEPWPEEHPFTWNLESESFEDACKRAPKESKLKWTWGISGPEIRTARFIYGVFGRGSMFSQRGDINPSTEEMWYLESRADAIAGVETKIKGRKLLALLAICNAGTALNDLLNRNEDERNWLVLESLNEAKTFLNRLKDILIQQERSAIIEAEEYISENERYTEIGKNYSATQREKLEERHKKQEIEKQLRDKYLIREANKLLKRRPNHSIRRIAAILFERIQNDPKYKWKHVGFETIRNIIKSSKLSQRPG
ncbi:MAG: hypothetical protein M0P57_09025 [Syntrophales bacterium]|nr:hypothetical protein [Syntrophales bacterium]